MEDATHQYPDQIRKSAKSPKKGKAIRQDTLLADGNERAWLGSLAV